MNRIDDAKRSTLYETATQCEANGLCFGKGTTQQIGFGGAALQEALNRGKAHQQEAGHSL